MESPGSAARRRRPDESGKRSIIADRETPAPRTAYLAQRSSLLNKPYGVLCQFTADGPRPTLADFVTVPGVYPAGRLDADSEGLVVLTADGALQARIADPRHHADEDVLGAGRRHAVGRCARRARARRRAAATSPRRRRACARSKPPALPPRDPPIRVRRAIPTAWLELTLGEGRNRQVRRMTAAVGLPTLRLVRYRLASWTIDGLAPGETRLVEGDA